MNKAYKMRCSQCNTTWNTKKTFNQHTSMCNFIHNSAKENVADMAQINLPSQTVLFHYIMHLTNKYEELEKKVARIQSATTRLRKKNIKEYLESMEKPTFGFNEWVRTIVVSEEHLKKLFDTNLEECIQSVLTPVIDSMRENLPIFAFSQRQHTFYIYDEDQQWHMMTQEEFSRFVYSLAHKVLRTYTKWSKEHYEELHANAKMEEQSMIYLSKANGINHTPEKRASILKKWLFTKLAVSLNHVD